MATVPSCLAWEVTIDLHVATFSASPHPPYYFQQALWVTLQLSR
jgi:hypothetical protein